MSVKILQLHKRASYQFKNIQDKFAFNEKQKCFALADGTTQSFNSEKWAEIITTNFVKQPAFVPEKLIELFTENVEEYKSAKFEFSTNPAKASLEKTKMQQGGTATFIGLQFVENNQIQLISCGDTNFFKINNKQAEYFPYSDVDSLDNNKHFINTEKLIEQKIDETYFQTKTISYSNNDIIILATDALSRLFLKEPKIILEFISIQNFEELHQFCLKYWENKQLEEDDISAIIIKIENKNNVQIIQPSTDFSFPEEKEEEFIPTSLTQSNNHELNNIDMQEIRHNFNGIAKDFNEVKKTLSFQQILTFSILGILVANIFLTYIYQPEEDNITSEMTTTIQCLESELKIANTRFKKLEAENIKLKNEKIEIQGKLTPNMERIKSNEKKSENIKNEVLKKETNEEK